MESPIAKIKPNIIKAFISNIFLVLIIVALIIGSLVYLDTVVGLDIFIDTFKEIGIEVSSASLLFWFIVIIIFVTALLLLLNYVTLGKITYTLYPDKIVYSKSLFIMHVTDKTIPYANISKISYENKAFLNTSKIIFELTGMKENKVTVDFIDDAAEITKKIQDLIRDYRANYYAKYSQEYRYQHIMDQV